MLREAHDGTNALLVAGGVGASLLGLRVARRFGLPRGGAGGMVQFLDPAGLDARRSLAALFARKAPVAVGERFALQGWAWRLRATGMP